MSFKAAGCILSKTSHEQAESEDGMLEELEAMTDNQSLERAEPEDGGLEAEALTIDQSLGQVEAKGSGLKVVYVPIMKLVRSVANFYSMSNLDALEDSIREVGLMHPLLVREKGGIFELIDGERRFQACKRLYDNGNEAYATIPCIVLINDGDMLAAYKLIQANSTIRELTDYEKTKQVEELEALITKLRKMGHSFKGRVRDIVAKEMDMSPTQIGRFESISKNLHPELKEDFKNKSISISDACDAAGLPMEIQQEIAQMDKQSRPEAIKKAKKAISSKAKEKEAGKMQSSPDATSKTTNASRVRNMTDEELASFLRRWSHGADCENISADNFIKMADGPDPAIMAWLRREVG